MSFISSSKTTVEHESTRRPACDRCLSLINSCCTGRDLAIDELSPCRLHDESSPHPLNSPCRAESEDLSNLLSEEPAPQKLIKSKCFVPKLHLPPKDRYVAQSHCVTFIKRAPTLQSRLFQQRGNQSPPPCCPSNQPAPGTGMQEGQSLAHRSTPKTTTP